MNEKPKYVYYKNKLSSNHMQSGNDYDASDFFPSQTDAQIEKARLRHMLREEKR